MDEDNIISIIILSACAISICISLIMIIRYFLTHDNFDEDKKKEDDNAED